MKILDPQSAILTNVEVLSHFTLNPPHRSPQPPPNSLSFTPHPDLRDHNTVVKEYHNYASRISPHLLKYPDFKRKSTSEDGAIQNNAQSPSAEPTDLDIAIRTLITKLKAFNLTKAEVLTIINLGVGLNVRPDTEGEDATNKEEEDTVMQDTDVNGDTAVNGEGDTDGDYGALALLDTVIEDREERLSNEDVAEILSIVRGTLGKGK